MAKDALVRIGTPALEPLFAALRHENPDTRFLAVRTLAELRDPSTLQPLQTIAEQDSNATNRQAARRALKSLLLDHLDHESADVRLQAVRGLQRLGDARTIEPLQALITSDPNDEVIYAARAAIIPLVQGVECDPFDEHNLPLRSRNTSLLLNQLQRQAGVTFARVASLDDLYSEAITLDMLFEFAHQHTDLGIQQLARNALIALCTDYLRCANAEARGLAVRGLATINAPALRDMLEPIAAYDPAESVRQAAQAALDSA